MSPRAFLGRAGMLAALACVGLAACDGRTFLSPPPPTTPLLTVAVLPASVSFTALGQKTALTAIVAGGKPGEAARGVVWSSSTPAVATVDQNGTVSAVANGTATIIATANAQPQAQAAAAVTVAVPPPSDTVRHGTPMVTIAAITSANGDNVDLTSVAGTIYVALNVDVPAGVAVDSVAWRVDRRNVCTQKFVATRGLQPAPRAAQSTLTCQVNTTTLAPPLNQNGPHELSAVLVGPGGIAQAVTTQSLVLNNPASLALAVLADTTARNAAGLVWYGRNLALTAAPTLYTGFAVTRVVFTLYRASAPAPLAQCADTVAPFSVTFAADSTASLRSGSLYCPGQPLRGLSDSVYVSVATVTAAGVPGPQAATDRLAYDNAGPSPVLYFLNAPDRWLVPSYSFISAIDTTRSDLNAARTGPVDGGVGGVRYTFYAGPSADSMSVVTTAGNLPVSASNTRYRTRAVLSDALGNTTTVAGSIVVAGDTSAAAAHFGVKN